MPDFWQRRDCKSRWNRIARPVAIFEAEPRKDNWRFGLRRVLGGYQQLHRADFLPRVLCEMAGRADRRTPVIESRSRGLVDAVLGVTRRIPPSRASRAAIQGRFTAFPGINPVFTIAAKLGPVRARRRALRRKWTG